MAKTRRASPNVGAAGSFDARAEAQLPTRTDAHASDVTREPTRARSSWFRIAARIVRDAAIAVALLTSVPIIIVATQGDRIWDNGAIASNLRARMKQVESLRSYGLPADPSITPMRAGLAYAALQPAREVAAFPSVEIASRPEASWHSATLTPEMFTTAVPDLYHGPSSRTILEAVPKGFTARETAFLRTLATAPVWRTFDVVARAQAVDVIGGRFRVPFAADASWEQMPIVSFRATKELAYAAVSRAAYHMSIGQRDSAEAVLRSIVSFGFATIDNSTNLIDELVGNVMVNIGRDGLRRFFVITHDPRANAPELAQPDNGALLRSREKVSTPRPSLDEVRRRLIAQSVDPSVIRGERFETLHRLSVSSCTNVSELMFGQRDDVTDAIRNARATLARYPSEQALVDIASRLPMPGKSDVQSGPIRALAISSATVAGVVLRNPRLASCARIVGGYPGNR